MQIFEEFEAVVVIMYPPKVEVRLDLVLEGAVNELHAVEVCE